MDYRNRFLAALMVAGFIVLASFGAMLYSAQVEIRANQNTLDVWTQK